MTLGGAKTGARITRQDHTRAGARASTTTAEALRPAAGEYGEQKAHRTLRRQARRPSRGRPSSEASDTPETHWNPAVVGTILGLLGRAAKGCRRTECPDA